LSFLYELTVPHAALRVDRFGADAVFTLGVACFVSNALLIECSGDVFLLHHVLIFAAALPRTWKV
jgi:hypothetical protein